MIRFRLMMGALLCAAAVNAQRGQEQGRPIGSVTVNGSLINLELNEGVLGSEHLFDLGHRTLRFTPEKTGYRVENRALQWESEFGRAKRIGSNTPSVCVSVLRPELEFSVCKCDRHDYVRVTAGRTGGRTGAFGLARFDQLGEESVMLINTAPAISVFLKPRMSGTRYVVPVMEA